jgi:hypothetical protein
MKCGDQTGLLLLLLLLLLLFSTQHDIQIYNTKTIKNVAVLKALHRIIKNSRLCGAILIKRMSRVYKNIKTCYFSAMQYFAKSALQILRLNRVKLLKSVLSAGKSFQT